MKTKNLLILPLTILTGLTSIVSKPVSFNNFTSVNKMINPLKADENNPYSAHLNFVDLYDEEIGYTYSLKYNFTYNKTIDNSKLLSLKTDGAPNLVNGGFKSFFSYTSNDLNKVDFAYDLAGENYSRLNLMQTLLMNQYLSQDGTGSIDSQSIAAGNEFLEDSLSRNFFIMNKVNPTRDDFEKCLLLRKFTGIGFLLCLNVENFNNQTSFVFSDSTFQLYYFSNVNHEGNNSSTNTYPEFEKVDITLNGTKNTITFEGGYTLTNGQSKTITINYASNYTQDEIIAMVKAKDLFGVDVPISVQSSDYVPNKVGNYTIVLQATDSYNQTATATLKVVAIDKNPPVVLKRKDLDVQYGQMVSNEQIFACFDVSDESGVEPTLEITNNGGFDFTNVAPNEVKSYTITITATDQSGNTATGTMTLNIIDTTPPSISKKEGSNTDIVKYGYSESYQLNKSTLLGLYTANDEVDGKVDLYIKSGEVDSSIGEHQITLGAKDKSNNESTLIVKYQILADIPPVFILDSKLVNTSTDSPLTKQQIEQVAKAIAPEGASLVTLTNEEEISTYQTNYDKVGSKYRISYAYKVNEETKQDYFMLQPSEDYVKEEKKSGWENFVEGWNNFFSNVSKFFQKLKNWFRGIFTHFEWNDFITDEEYNIKHNK